MQSIINVKHLIQRHLKTFEKERNCNRNRSTLQKCIKIQFFDLMHTNLLVIGNRGSENRRNILEIKITMLKRVEKFCDPRWSWNLCNTTIRRHCTLHCTPLPFNGLVLSLSPTDRRVLVLSVSRECYVGRFIGQYEGLCRVEFSSSLVWDRV